MKPLAPNTSTRALANCLLFTVCCLLISASIAIAQSGRRGTPTAPAPVPTPAPEPTPLPSKPVDTKPAFRFIVVVDKTGDFSRLSLNDFSAVIRSCADRLNDSRSVKADASSKDMSRSEAVRQAKEETEAYMVSIQLRPNTFTERMPVNGDPYNVYVQYSVLAPTTGKQVTSGNVYPDAYRNQRVRVPTSPMNGDYYLNMAARGAAERILDHFHLTTPNTRPPF
ncbi:MAG TPA: hypothetical protein VGN90_02055 [Pyrinomonadaceae bacterium]|jgi:hypothetical protein|nr:hypothetical protein [Pyrinomonadaceae bacterium]